MTGSAFPPRATFGPLESHVHAKISAYEGLGASEVPGYPWETPYPSMYNRSEIGMAQPANLIAKDLEWQKAGGMQPLPDRMKRQRIDQEIDFVQKDALVVSASERVVQSGALRF